MISSKESSVKFWFHISQLQALTINLSYSLLNCWTLQLCSLPERSRTHNFHHQPRNSIINSTSESWVRSLKVWWGHHLKFSRTQIKFWDFGCTSLEESSKTDLSTPTIWPFSEPSWRTQSARLSATSTTRIHHSSNQSSSLHSWPSSINQVTTWLNLEELWRKNLTSTTTQRHKWTLCCSIRPFNMSVEFQE